MNSIDYCRERVAVPGSSYYYSTLWLGSELQRGVYSLLAFKDAIAEVPRTCADPVVAGRKLAFWREELARIEARAPARHPIAELMAWVARTYGLEPRSLGTTLAAAEQDVGPGGYACHESLVRHFEAMWAPIWRWCARIHGYRDEATPQAVADLGAAIELAARVQDLRAETARGRIRIPQDALVRHGVPGAALLERKSPARLRDLVAEHCERIGADLAQAMARVPAVDRPAQQSVVILAEILLVTLAEIRRDGYRILDHRIALTPLRKLWIAWRTRRRLTGGRRG
ncbi:MAG: squalene/phytoene synthase family protein [Gammaproteobacteria bacterium]